MARKKITVNSERTRRLERPRFMSSGLRGKERNSSKGSNSRLTPILFSSLSTIPWARAMISSWKRGKLFAKCGRSKKMSTPRPPKIAAKKMTEITTERINGIRSLPWRSTTSGSMR